MLAPQKVVHKFLPWMGKKMLFIHTPKCGGSYISSSFGSAQKRCISVRRKDLKGHLTYVQYKKRLHKIGIDINEFILFSVVRNPFDWHVSWYNYVKKDAGGKKSGMPIEHSLFKNMSFSDYLLYLEDQPFMERPNQYYLMQMCDWVTDENGDLLNIDILNQETLSEDLSKLKEKHQIIINPSASRINQSFHGDYRKFYKDSDIDIVSRRHSKDIAIFGYKFG